MPEHNDSRLEVAGVYQSFDQEHRAMADLWRSVVAQAIRDMDLGGRRHRNDETIRTELDALQWIGTEDFHLTCACALIDGEELELRLREVIQMGAPYRRLLLRDLADMIREQPPSVAGEEAMLDAALADEPDLEPSGD